MITQYILQMQLYCHLIPYEMIDKCQKIEELLALSDDSHIKTKLQMKLIVMKKTETKLVRKTKK